MKRILSLVLVALVVAATAALTVFAASDIQFKLSADKASVKPGDVVSCSVEVSNGAPCTQFGLKFDYDTSVFEVTTGKCTATGALLTDFGAERGFAVLYGSATAPAGTVGTFVLKVKDTAAAGTYEIAFQPAAKNGAADVASRINTVSITVTDDHTYGSWEKVDDTTHRRQCADCDQVQTGEHRWDMGTVTQVPTCDQAGAKSSQCSDCGAKKTEAISSIGHSYDAVWQYDGQGHWQLCLRCGSQTEVSAHTMETAGCSVCGFTGDADAEHTHTFSQGWAYDSEKHWHICSCGVKQDEAVHTWDENGTCTACGTVSTQADRQDTQASQPADDRDPSAEAEDFPWGTVFVVLVAILAAAGVIVFLIYKKKTA